MKAKIRKTGEIVDVYHVEQHGCVSNIYRESVLVDSRTWTEDELEFYEEREKDNCIDAFIEKATAWLNNNLDDVVEIRVPGTIIPHRVLKRDFIDDFAKHMKGE